jgi:copper chaperone CopZ
MKKIQTIFLLLIIATITTVSCNQIKEETRVIVQSEEDSLLVVKIPDAACEKCQKVIEGGLSNDKGIKQSILNLTTQEVSVVYDPKLTSEGVIMTEIQELRPNMPCYSGKELVR